MYLLSEFDNEREEGDQGRPQTYLLTIIPLRVLYVNQRPIPRPADFDSHDLLMALHELVAHHLQMLLALRYDVFLGASIQQVDVPVDKFQLAETVGGDHHLVIGILDGFGLDLDVGH